ncbi:hypothetical protein RCH14_000383 [Massilia sp. MP_M2]|uniref:hypothetical protein n=1 Tax=Massilia sp. MP_M2 TaxID=3071713 RepID=UPI00319EAFC7
MITALTDPNQLPNQLQDQQTFDANMAYVIDMLPERARQENELAAEMAGLVSQVGVIAAGGAFAIPYVFDTTTTDADPGAGKLRLSSATQNTATLMRVDLTSAGQDYTTLIDTFDDSTSAVKGSIRLVKQGDITKWMTFNLTALAAPTGYRNLTVVCTDSSAASPFTNGDALMLSFQRTGDKGDKPLGGALVCLASVTISAGVTSISYPNIFTSEYDRYTIEFIDALVPSSVASFNLRLATGGTLAAGSVYFGGPNAADLSSATTAFNLIAGGGSMGGATPSPSFSIDIFNANSGGRNSLHFRSVFLTNTLSQQSGTGFGIFNNTGALTGFQLYPASGNITGGKLRVYGHRNQVGIA